MALLQRLFVYHTLYCIISVASDQSCLKPKECVGQTLNDSGITYASGYKAAFGPTTSFSGDEIECSGSFSCHSMKLMRVNSNATTIVCNGKESCSRNTIQSSASDMDCYGLDSCSFSNLTFTTNRVTLNCGGYLSCRNTYIHGVEDINGYGSLSMYRATIDTIDTIDNTVINLEGSLAGFGAKLICRENHICQVFCHTFDSCHMFYMECIGTCIINTTNTSFNVPIAPITNSSHFNNANLNVIPTFFGSEAFVPSNDTDKSCTETWPWSFDTSRERRDGTIKVGKNNQGPICCRGFESCEHSQIEFQTQINNDLICSGHSSCKDTSITSNNGSIYCEGHNGCKYAAISYAHGLYCLGDRSCKEATVTKIRYITCSGQLSCENANIISGGFNLNVYFVGRASARGVALYCNDTDLCNIHCSGYKSCDDLTLICQENCNLECNATDSTCPLYHSNTLAPKQSTTYESFYNNTWDSNQTHKISTSAPLATEYPSVNTLNATNAFAVTTIYTISIKMDDCEERDGYCTIDQVNNVILLAFLDYNATILDFDIINNKIRIELSVKTDRDQILSTDDIKQNIEHELEKYEDVDVNVDVNVDVETEVSETPTASASDEWIVAAFIVIGCLLCIILMYTYKSMKFLYRKNVVEVQKQLELQEINPADDDTPEAPQTMPGNAFADEQQNVINDEGEGEQREGHDNKTNDTHNMNEQNDTIMIGEDDTTTLEQPKIVYNMNAEDDGIVIGDDEVTSGRHETGDVTVSTLR